MSFWGGGGGSVSAASGTQPFTAFFEPRFSLPKVGTPGVCQERLCPSDFATCLIRDMPPPSSRIVASTAPYSQGTGGPSCPALAVLQVSPSYPYK